MIGRTATPPDASIPIAGESLPAWATRIARTRSRQHLGRLLQEIGLPYLSKAGAIVRGGADAESIAAVLDINVGEVRRRLHAPTPYDGFECIAGVCIRAVDVTTQTRRFSPATLAKKGTHLQVWTVRTLPYCAVSSEYLVDTCARCSKVQRWKQSINVMRCDHCGSGLWLHEAQKVEPQLRDRLLSIAAVVDPGHTAHATTLAALPACLRNLDAGEVFELLLTIARIAVPAIPLRESQVIDIERQRTLCRGLAAAWDIVTDWPSGLSSLMCGLSSTPGGGRRLRDAAQVREGRPALAAVTKLISEIASTRDGIRVEAAARMLGVTAGEVASARDEGALATRMIFRHGRLCSNLDAAEIESLTAIRQDRIGRYSAATMLGIPSYGVEQLVEADLLQTDRHPWLLRRYGEPTLIRINVGKLIGRIEAKATDKLADPVDLASGMRGYGGGPKPWAAVFGMLLEGKLRFMTMRNTDGRLSVSISSHDMDAIRAITPPDGLATYSQVDSLEILNMPANKWWCLIPLKNTSTMGRTWSIDGGLLNRTARANISIAEMMKRTGLSHKRLEQRLRNYGLKRVSEFGWSRECVEAAILGSGDREIILLR